MIVYKNNRFSDMEYEQLQNLATSFIDNKINLSNDDKTSLILVYSLNGLDFKINEQLGIKLLEDDSIGMRRDAIVCAGHIARVYKKLVDDKILRYAVKHYNKGDELWGVIDDMFDEVEIYLKIKRKDIITKYSVQEPKIKRYT